MTSKQLFNVLVNTTDSLNGKNYFQNRIDVYVYSDGITVETSFQNEYGGIYSNEDTTFLPWCSMGEITRGYFQSQGSEWVVLHLED